MQTQTTTQTQALHDALQETFTLYRATHLAHWNVRGPHFPQLHALFEEQYNELWLALDTIAERIRALGGVVEPGTLTGDPTPRGDDAPTAVRDLAQRHRAIAKHLRNMEADAASANDVATADLFTERIRSHDQMAWMLEATAEGL